MGDKRRLIEPEAEHLSLTRQCELLGLACSSWYHKPVEVDSYELRLMNLVDRQYTATPFYGIRQMTAWLATQGECVNHKRVARLMRQMGIEAIYARPNTSAPGDNVRRYPYLLKGMKIEEPNQVWSTDIRICDCRMDLCGGSGLVQSICFSLGGVKHNGCEFLFERAECGKAANLQFRPRATGYQ